LATHFYGKTHLYDTDRGMLLHGDVSVSTDANGQSVVRIRNDSTHAERVLITSGAVAEFIQRFMDAAWEVHHQVDVPVFVTAPVCPCCKGVQEVEDQEGNWVTCNACCG